MPKDSAWVGLERLLCPEIKSFHLFPTLKVLFHDLVIFFVVFAGPQMKSRIRDATPFFLLTGFFNHYISSIIHDIDTYK